MWTHRSSRTLSPWQGLLVAEVSVTSGFRQLLPRWLVALGIVIAAVAELATLTLLVPQLVYLVPAARVLGLVWLILTALKLPTALRDSDAPRAPLSAGGAVNRAFPPRTLELTFRA